MSHDWPSFSVIVPTYSRPHALDLCLESLTRLRYPREKFEVIVVDDGSPQLPDQLVRRYRDRMSVELTTTCRRKAGPGTARNIGAAQAEGEFLAFTDDDCRIDSNWLEHFARRFLDDPEQMLGGNTVCALPSNPYSTASQLLISYFYVYHRRRDFRGCSFFTSNNFAIPAIGVRKVGGFVPFPLAAAEDREFCERWQHFGLPMTYVPEAVVYHAHALNLLSFCELHFRYGRGACWFHHFTAKRGRRRIRLEPASFYRQLLTHAWKVEAGRRAVVFSTLVALSQVIHTAGFLIEKISPTRTGREKDAETEGR